MRRDLLLLSAEQPLCGEARILIPFAQVATDDLQTRDERPE